MSLGRMELALRGADLDYVNRIRSGRVAVPEVTPTPQEGWRNPASGPGALFEVDRVVAQSEVPTVLAEGAVALGGADVQLEVARPVM